MLMTWTFIGFAAGTMAAIRASQSWEAVWPGMVSKKGKIIATSDFLVLQDEKRIEAREMWQKRRASGSTARLNR